jgi:chromosome segregation ATPase
MGTSNSRATNDTAERGASSERGGAQDALSRDGESAQSGVRAAPAFGARLEAALAASSRTEATLADLFRTAKFLSATIASVREANAVLARELESLAQAAAGGGDERASLAGRIHRLEKVLDEATEESVRERQRLLAEHDEFIKMLLADHERELDSLRKRLADMAPPTLRGAR